MRAVNHEPAHPPADQLEAAAFGRLADDQARVIRVHAVQCPTCSRFLAIDDQVRQCLATLRGREP